MSVLQTESPPRVVTASSSRGSLVSSEDEKGDDSEKEDKADGLKPESGDEAPKFKSPLLQKLTEGKAQNGDSGTPKFKSPLLQSIMGKTKIGARLSGTRLDEMDRSTENLSASRSIENLSDKEKDSESEKERDTSEVVVSNGVKEKCDSGDKLLEDDSLVRRSDVDSHDTTSSVIGQETGMPLVYDGMTASQPITDSQILIGSTADSAVSLSFNGVTTSHNGDIHIEAKDLIDSKDLVDSRLVYLFVQ